MAVSIFDYLDYQTFLRDWFTHAKRSTERVSYQKLAERAGIQSKGYIHKVFTGLKPLSLRSYDKIAPLVVTKESENRYFKLLIQLRASQSDVQTSVIMKEVETLINPEVYTLERNTYAYFNQWYHPVIREMVCRPDFDNDFQRLGKMLSPPIAAREVQNSVKLLLNLKLIEYREGVYYQTTQRLTNNNSQVNQAVSGYIKKMMEMGKRALETFTPDERYIVSVTAGISEEGYGTVEQILKECRDKIDEVLKDEESVEKVCQFNMQLFPLTVDKTKGVR